MGNRGEEGMPPSPSRRWFPFSATEVEVALGLYALLTSALAFLGVERHALAWLTLGYLAFVYQAGLLVHARRSGFTFLRDGALRGAGYARFFRHARQSLLLLHTDDDSPSDELLGLYRTLLERGVELLERGTLLAPERVDERARVPRPRCVDHARMMAAPAPSGIRSWASAAGHARRWGRMLADRTCVRVGCEEPRGRARRPANRLPHRPEFPGPKL